jgi:hypothetical protein
MMTVTREIREAIRDILEEEYGRRRSVGNRTLEAALVRALESAPVRETISDALDIYLGEQP